MESNSTPSETTVVLITTLRERRNQQGKTFLDAAARNARGNMALRLPGDSTDPQLKPGLWTITGHFDTTQERNVFIVENYQLATIEAYRAQNGTDPILPRAFTLDIETLSLPDFRERVGSQLERSLRLGNMRFEQQQRYLEDIAAEEERCYSLGSLNATTGRVLSIAVQVGPVAGLEFCGVTQETSEHVFGIDKDGFEVGEKRSLTAFLDFMKDFDAEVDEVVGHNIIGFDLPFIFQRCLVNQIRFKPFVNLAEYNPRGVFDTMHRWWLGAKRTVSLDDLAWVLGIESSKTSEVEGSKVFDLYQTGRLELIREYNLNDVRVTRKVYERLVSGFGR